MLLWFRSMSTVECADFAERFSYRNVVQHVWGTLRKRLMRCVAPAVGTMDASMAGLPLGSCTKGFQLRKTLQYPKPRCVLLLVWSHSLVSSHVSGQDVGFNEWI